MEEHGKAKAKIIKETQDLRAFASNRTHIPKKFAQLRRQVNMEHSKEKKDILPQ